MSRPWVLMYHAVEPYDEDPHVICVSPQRFAAQMAWLARRGLRGVSVAELRAARGSGRARTLVGLTFDDAYAGLRQHAVPVLRRHGFTATVFAVAGRMGGHNDWDDGPRRRLMSATDLRDVAGCGLEVGSHGMTHARLTDVDADRVVEEVSTSRALLRDATGLDVEGFCYPYGAQDAGVVAAVDEAGYDYACAYLPDVADDRFRIPRAFIGERDGAGRLTAKRAVDRLSSRRRGDRP